MEKVIVCDTGGSKTILRELSLTGKMLKEYKTCGFGRAEDSDDNLPPLAEILDKIDERDSVKKVAVNLGGKNKSQIKNIFSKYFNSAEIVVARESEGDVCRVLSMKYSAEVVLLAGTGSIAVADLDNNPIICGGWGMNVGDFGSGYDIGLNAVRQSLIELESAKPLSALTKKLTGRDKPFMVGEDFCRERDKVRSLIFPQDRAKIASFSKIVVNCATLGDELSIKILNKAGQNLADLVINTAKLAKKELTSVVFSGGLVNAGKFITESFEKKLKEVTGVEKFIYLKDGVIEGLTETALQVTF